MYQARNWRTAPGWIFADMSKRMFNLVHDAARANALECIRSAPAGYCVTVAEPTRNLEQNARLWASLGQIAKQVVWHGRKLDADSWKHIFSSSLKKQEVVPNLDGTGFVVMGVQTSKMSKADFSELIELINAFAAEHNVDFGG